MMKVKFKNSAVLYGCTEPVEQKLFRSGIAYGWAIMFHVQADVSSSEVDEVISADNISEITFLNDAGAETVITGYSTISNCTIRHKEDKTVVELQFTKTSETKVSEETENTETIEE